MTKPKLSIVLITYNRSQRLMRALENYTKNLRSDIEFIISDNASTDDTKEVVAEFQARDHRIRYFCNPRNLGPNRNLFRAFLEVQADFFMILSDDDLLTEGFIDEVIDCTEKNPEIAFVCHARRTEVEPGVYQKDFYCPRETILYEKGHRAVTAVYARSSSISGSTYSTHKIDLDDWRLDHSIYPQVRLACMLAADHPVVYFSSQESTLIPNNGDSIAKTAQNRPADMGVHERIDIALDVVGRLPKRKRYAVLNSLLKPIRDWSANLFVCTYQEDRRLAFVYLAALINHSQIAASGRFWTKLIKASFSEVSFFANVRIFKMLAWSFLRSLLNIESYKNLLAAIFGINNVIKRLTTRRFAKKVFGGVTSCFNPDNKTSPKINDHDPITLDQINSSGQLEKDAA